MSVTIGERLRDWAGSRVSVVYSHDETQFGDLLEVGEDFIVLQAGSIQYVINMDSIVRINRMQEQ